VQRRGCADRLVGFEGRLYLVELKRPRGSRKSIQQTEDAKFWAAVGVVKIYLYTVEEVDAWIKEIT